MTGRAMAARSGETGTGSTEGNSAVANGDGPQTTDNRENIVTTSEQQAVPVAQEDREAAMVAFTEGPYADAVLAGGLDHHAIVQAFARHRLASVSSASAEPSALDWRKIAKAAGEHGVRYRTNTALERFLSDISAFPEPVPATNQAGEVALRAGDRVKFATGESGEIIRCDYVVQLDEADGSQGAMGGSVGIWTVDASELTRASLASQPATSQEGEAQRSYETLDQATSRITKAAITESLSVIAKAFDDLLIDRDEWRTQHEALLDVRQQDLAALATQPATSQEGEKPNRWYADAPKNIWLHGIGGGHETTWADDPSPTGDAEEEAHAVGYVRDDLAATPTPPTLSEDLRKTIAQLVDPLPFDDGPTGWNGMPATREARFHRAFEIADAILAALARAQVKAS